MSVLSFKKEGQDSNGPYGFFCYAGVIAPHPTRSIEAGEVVINTFLRGGRISSKEAETLKVRLRKAGLPDKMPEIEAVEFASFPRDFPERAKEEEKLAKALRQAGFELERPPEY